MFSVLCLFLVILPTIAIFVKDKKIQRDTNQTASKKNEKTDFGKAFFVLVFANSITLGLIPRSSAAKAITCYK